MNFWLITPDHKINLLGLIWFRSFEMLFELQ